MTRPKKWYLDSYSGTQEDNTRSECQTVLKTSDGSLIKKSNASSYLGPILSVEVPDEQHCGKNSPSECVLVSCA